MRIPPWMLPQTVTVTPYLGRTGEGPSYGAPFAVRCRVELSTRYTSTNAGDDVEAIATIFAAPDAPVTVEDLVTLPDGRPGTVIAIDKPGGPGGAVHHVEILVGRLLNRT
jgi:hypothetical protein